MARRCERIARGMPCYAEAVGAPFGPAAGDGSVIDSPSAASGPRRCRSAAARCRFAAT